MGLARQFARPYRLLDRVGRRDLLQLAIVFVLAGVASAAMVVSVFPFLTLLSNPDALSKNAWLSDAYHSLGFRSERSFLTVLGVGAIIVTASANLLILLRVYLLSRFLARQKVSLSTRLFNRYLGNSYSFFLSRHSSELQARVLSQSDEVAQNAFRPIAELLSSCVSVASIMIVLVWLNPMVALGALFALGAGYGIILVSSRKFIRRVGHERAVSNEQRHRVVGEAFGTIKAIKLYGLEAFSSGRFDEPSRTFAKAEVSMNLVAELPRSAIQTIALACVIVFSLLISAGGADEEASKSLLPLLGVLGMAGMRLQPEVQRLFSSLTRLQFVGHSFDRLAADLLGENLEQSSAQDGQALRLTRSIDVRGVSYAYPETSRAVVEDLTLTIKKGQRIGLVGSTGAGKSTLADLLLGLLVPQAGEIRIDGIPLGPGNTEMWRKSVGYVPQDIALRDADVTENIAYGVSSEDIDHEKVRQAARIANIDSFVETQLPEGYGTMIGERGIRLSGGQRQRIAIARALYREVDLIVFDEATSALDNLTEAEIMKAIAGLPGDKTVLLIAHRLSTVKNSDCIYVMEHGRIAFSGDWDTLMSESRLFRELVKTGETERAASGSGRGLEPRV